jgi:hypothetical protein
MILSSIKSSVDDDSFIREGIYVKLYKELLYIKKARRIFLGFLWRFLVSGNKPSISYRLLIITQIFFQAKYF